MMYDNHSKPLEFCLHCHKETPGLGRDDAGPGITVGATCEVGCSEHVIAARVNTDHAERVAYGDVGNIVRGDKTRHG